MKCKKCGQEFQGNFCPNCGTPALKICPQCGKEHPDGAKFCPDCGYRLEPMPAAKRYTTAQPATPVQPVYAQPGAPVPIPEKPASPADIFFFVPAIAFALISVLMFAFLAANTATFSFFGYNTEALGNGYDMLSEYSGTLDIDLSDISDTVIATIIFAIIGIALSVLMFIQLMAKGERYRTIELFGKKFYRITALYAVAGVVLFIYFLLGCILCGQANGAISGFTKAGAGPVLIVVFSILFGILMLAPVARHFLAKKFPEYAEYEGQLAAISEAERRQKSDAGKDKATETAVIDIPNLEKLKTAIPKGGIVRNVNKVMRRKRRIAFVLLMLLAATVIGGIWLLLLLFDDSYIAEVTFISLSVSLWLIAFVAGFTVIVTRCETTWDEKKCRKNGGMTAIAVIMAICAIAWLAFGIIMILTEPVFKGLSSFYIGLIISIYTLIEMVFLGFFGAAIFAKKKNRKLCEYFYGSKKPAKDAPLLHTFAEENAEYIAYVQNKKAVRTYRYKNYCAKKGKQPVKAINWICANRVTLSITAGILVVVILLCSIIPSVLGNIFRVSLVSKIDLSYGTYWVTYYLGEPDEIEESDEPKYIYYDNSYGIITVEFEVYSYTSYSHYKVTAVWMDMGATLNDMNSGNNAKTLSSVTVLSGTVRQNSSTASISYEAKFKDGSYVKAYATASISGSTETLGESVTITWSDKWYNGYSATMTVS